MFGNSFGWCSNRSCESSHRRDDGYSHYHEHHHYHDGRMHDGHRNRNDERTEMRGDDQRWRDDSMPWRR